MTRAIDSVYRTDWHGVEVIVVDDASVDDTVDVVRDRYPEVRLLRMPSNSGPGAARNAGISAATAQWALMLDDDDLLMPDALLTVSHVLRETPELDRYPVIQFAHCNATLQSPFLVASLTDYLEGSVSGDFAPVIQTRVFGDHQYRYPECRIGGEHLMWYQIAKTCGIPTWSRNIIQVTRDAESNLCSLRTQLERPREYAELQEETLKLLGRELLDINPAFYRKKVIGAITYRLLAGDSAIARSTITDSPQLRMVERITMRALSYLPRVCVRKAFSAYRESSF